MKGFFAKHDSGTVRFWGKYDERFLTAWTKLGGPVVGFHFEGEWTNRWGQGIDLSIIVGDECRPKYFGTRKLSVRMGEERQVQFYWQEDFQTYYAKCRSEGHFYIQNSE